MPLTSSATTSFIGGSSLAIVGIPNATASYSGRPRPSQRDGEMRDVVGGDRGEVLVPGLVGEPQLDPRVGLDHRQEHLEPGALDLRLDEQPQVVAAGRRGTPRRPARPACGGRGSRPGRRTGRGRRRCGERAPRAARGGCPTGPAGSRGPSRRSAPARSVGHRVDDVVGARGRLEVLAGEVLPDEAADDPDAARAQLGELVELVVLVAEDRRRASSPRPRPRTRPSGVSKLEAAVTSGWSQTPVRSSAPRHRPLLAPRLGEDEAPVAELVDRGADVAADDRLAAVEPLADDADVHALSPPTQPEPASRGGRAPRSPPRTLISRGLRGSSRSRSTSPRRDGVDADAGPVLFARLLPDRRDAREAGGREHLLEAGDVRDPPVRRVAVAPRRGTA